MFSTHSQFSSHSQCTAIVMIPAIIYTLLLALPNTLASAYMFNPNNILTMEAAQHQQQQYQPHRPTSALASKVLFHSPSVANIYKELIVSSKPLHLRKHGNGPKAKKTKKDSKIYYIPIPPMPYRYIPGVGLDYQPMKIKPILQETPAVLSNSMAALNQIAHVSSANAGGGEPTTIGLHQHAALNQPNENKHTPVMGNDVVASVYASANQNKINVPPAGRPTASESKLYRMNHGEYYFNGRPFRLQVAHAQPKNQLTPLNLKSKLYFNKNIIY